MIANLKAKYKRRVHNQARIMEKTVKDIREFVAQITIFDAILHSKNAWDSVSAETIVKCFRYSGVYNLMLVLHVPLSKLFYMKTTKQTLNSMNISIIYWAYHGKST